MGDKAQEIMLKMSTNLGHKTWNSLRFALFRVLNIV